MENNTQVSLNEMLTVSSSPHVRTDRTTNKIMRDVVIALIPALLGSVYFFGMRALLLTVLSILSAVGAEALMQKIMKKPISVNDFSAVVTGMLLAFNLPASAPWWVPIFGSFFAIVIVKQLFGGLGSNFMNPALAARATIMISWPDIMASFPAPIRTICGSCAPDAISSATPMFMMKGAGANVVANLPSHWDMFVGNIGGCLGETSKLLLLIGAIYLILRDVIDWETPVIYILTTVAMLFILGVPVALIPYEVLGGGLILGAFFMATDYTTTPVSLRGRIVFALGCGILTAIIRVKGGMPEGVSYSILFMNILTPLIEKATAPAVFGRSKKK